MLLPGGFTQFLEGICSVENLLLKGQCVGPSCGQKVKKNDVFSSFFLEHFLDFHVQHHEVKEK